MDPLCFIRLTSRLNVADIQVFRVVVIEVQYMFSKPSDTVS